VVKEPAGIPKFRDGGRVRLTLFDMNSNPRDYLAKKFLKYDGYVGTVINSASPSVNDNTPFIYNIRIGNKERIQLTEDCLESV